MKRIEFKYHPNLYTDEVLIHGERVCNCCRKTVSEYIDMVYSAEDLDCICLSCIHDGSAAEKFNAEFVQYATHGKIHIELLLLPAAAVIMNYK